MLWPVIATLASGEISPNTGARNELPQVPRMVKSSIGDQLKATFGLLVPLDVAVLVVTPGGFELQPPEERNAVLLAEDRDVQLGEHGPDLARFPDPTLIGQDQAAGVGVGELQEAEVVARVVRADAAFTVPPGRSNSGPSKFTPFSLISIFWSKLLTPCDVRQRGRRNCTGTPSGRRTGSDRECSRAWSRWRCAGVRAACRRGADGPAQAADTAALLTLPVGVVGVRVLGLGVPDPAAPAAGQRDVETQLIALGQFIGAGDRRDFRTRGCSWRADCSARSSGSRG